MLEVNLSNLDEHVPPKQKLDPGEHIDTHLVDIIGLLETLDKFVQKGYMIDQKIWHFAAGLAFQSEIEVKETEDVMEV